MDKETTLKNAAEATGNVIIALINAGMITEEQALKALDNKQFLTATIHAYVSL